MQLVELMRGQRPHVEPHGGVVRQQPGQAVRRRPRGQPRRGRPLQPREVVRAGRRGVRGQPRGRRGPGARERVRHRRRRRHRHEPVHCRQHSSRSDDLVEQLKFQLQNFLAVVRKSAPTVSVLDQNFLVLFNLQTKSSASHNL